MAACMRSMRQPARKLWEADTIIDRKLPYSSTGAPQIAGSVVVIGNSGADMGHGAVRGYISAYDLETGALKWRFFTVPPAVGQPYENPELAAADKTWDPHRKPEFKGGATAWDGFAYDAKLNLLYFGTANAAPYDLRQLGPKQLDSLYATCIIALDATTGRMAWYYQETPHDSWDYDAVQKMVLADITIDGAPRPVIMQASKNAFFYVLDRKTGKLLSAKNYAFMNWATHVDMKTGRPVTTPQSDWYNTAKLTYPSWFGAHTWNPMSYSPQTQLVYIPVIDVPTIWVDLLHNGSKVKYVEGFFHGAGHHSRRHLRCERCDAFVRPGAGRAGGQGRASCQTGARTDSRLGSGRRKGRVGTRNLFRNPRLRRRRDVDRGKSGVSRPRQRRVMGLCGRYRQSTQGSENRQPHHGGADDLRDQRRAVCRGSSGIRRHRDHGGAHPAEQRRPQISKHQSNYRLQTGRRRGADAAGANRTAVPEAARAKGDAGADRCGRSDRSSSNARAAISWARAPRPTFASSTTDCTCTSRTSCCAACWRRPAWNASTIF